MGGQRMTRALAAAALALSVQAGAGDATWSAAWREAARATVPARPRVIVLGRSRIDVPRGAIVGAQVDRVVRDIHWTDSPFDSRVPADRPPRALSELVPYMEGARIGELLQYAGVTVAPLTPARVRLMPARDGQPAFGLADDGTGRFRFVVDSSKVEYASARRLSADLLELPDTHGFNAVAAAAVRTKPFLAVACMDMPSKAEAALYVANRGIHAYSTTDRFAYTLLGYRSAHPGAATIVGSAPIRRGPHGGAVIGNQPVEIRTDETIVAQWTDRQSYPWQYNDTGWRYFEALNELYGLKLDLVKATADAGQLEKVIDVARARNARVVAVRAGKANTNDEAVHDAKVLAAWLQEDPRHRAVLFHSAAYDPGYELFFHYPDQTTFGDLEPVIR